MKDDDEKRSFDENDKRTWFEGSPPRHPSSDPCRRSQPILFMVMTMKILMTMTMSQMMMDDDDGRE